MNEAELRAEVEQLRGIVRDYEHRISWDTTCKHCAQTYDLAASQTFRAESAEAEVARLTRLLEQRTAALTRTIDAKNAAEAEAGRLRDWKAEAAEVILGLQDVGRALGVGLGEQITGRSGLDAAKRLIARAEAAEARASAMAARASILAEVPNEGWCYSCGDLVDESDVAPVVARLRGQVARVEAIATEYESHFDEAADKGEATPAHAALLGAAHAIRAALDGGQP